MFRSEGERGRQQRPGGYTPPYVTARPEVEHRKIHPNNDETLKFIIMATDGREFRDASLWSRLTLMRHVVWDSITSEEATLLVASYLKHRTHPDIPKTILPTAFPLMPTSPQERLYPIQDLPGTASRSNGAWVFEGDENAATHLIRNSLAGADRQYRAELLSMHGKVVRRVRDDVTVT